ncbi:MULTISPECIES: helix-turn-helix transcriptional regulator [unclassified Roseitalea]|uniref:helix-turn-helix transcriptional regulator n=1 Tax=unclassified Roseitalea TaxID=2639107 RepID=UPI00273DFB0B|nr:MULTISPECIES: helix-turn-helix transcriptional regulator [unclassified Roseitalea]
MIDFKEFRKELLADPAVKAEIDRLQPEFEMMRKFIAARKAAGMTQADVARAMGKSQPYVARLESGRANPSIKSIRDYARATGQTITLEIAP